MYDLKSMRNKACISACIRLFNICVIFLPLGVASVLTLFQLRRPTIDMLRVAEFPVDNWLAPILVIMGIIFLIYIILMQLESKGKNWTIPVSLFVISAVIRLVLVYIFHEEVSPFSDFQRTWSMAHGDRTEYFSYYTLFPAYLNYSIYESQIINIMGDDYANVLYLNAIMAGLTTVLIYLISMKIVKKTSVSVLAGLLYSFMPSSVAFTLVGSPDFLAVLFNMLGALILMKAMDSDWRYQCLFSAVAGVALGIGSSYKTFGVVIIIAFGMSLIARLIGEDNLIIKDQYYKRVATTILCIILLYVSHKLTGQFIVSITEHIYQIKLNPGASYPHFLLIGLNTEGEGQFHIGTLSNRYYIRYLENGLDLDDAREYAFQLLKNDWLNNSDKILPLFLKKFVHAWNTDAGPAYYFLTSVGIQADSGIGKIVFEMASKSLLSVSHIYYIVLIIFATVANIFYCGTSKEINYKMEFCLLIIFGYFCMIMLSEAQSRYKILIMPLVSFLSAYGIICTINAVSAFINKKCHFVS